MNKDITSRKEIYTIISKFYALLLADKEMFPFFEEFVKKNALEQHLNNITDFWEDILLNSKNYKNNVLQKHIESHQKTTFRIPHFDKWLTYFTTTIDKNNNGLNAELMKNRAKSIATVMQIKMKNLH